MRDINKFSNNVMARQLYLTLAAELGGPPAQPRAGGARQSNACSVPRASSATSSRAKTARACRATSARARPPRGAAAGSVEESRDAGVHVSRSPSWLPTARCASACTSTAPSGNAHIKTGLLHDTRSIAGYVLDRSGRRHALVMIANHPAPAGEAAFDALLQWVRARGPAPPTAESTRRLDRCVHDDRPAPAPRGLRRPLVGGVDAHLRAQPRYGAREVEVVDRRVLDTTVSRAGSTRVVSAQITSFQSRMSTSSSHHDDELRVHELAQEAPDAEHHRAWRGRGTASSCSPPRAGSCILPAAGRNRRSRETASAAAARTPRSARRRASPARRAACRCRWSGRSGRAAS